MMPPSLSLRSRSRTHATAADSGVGGAGFTLVELLTVMAVMAVMLGLVIPVFRTKTDPTTAAYTVSGVLEQARTYAMANNTYVWVGIYEENGAKPSDDQLKAAPGIGRVVLATVASKDGSRYSIENGVPDPFGNKSSQTNSVQLVAINKLIKVDNVHIAAVNTESSQDTSNTPKRPGVLKAYQVDCSTDSQFKMKTSFTYPLTVNGNKPNSGYVFENIIEFNSLGEASKIYDSAVNGPQEWLEIALQPTHGDIIDQNYKNTTNKAAAVVQVEGLTGKITIIRL